MLKCESSICFRNPYLFHFGIRSKTANILEINCMYICCYVMYNLLNGHIGQSSTNILKYLLSSRDSILLIIYSEWTQIIIKVLLFRDTELICLSEKNVIVLLKWPCQLLLNLKRFYVGNDISRNLCINYYNEWIFQLVSNYW